MKIMIKKIGVIALIIACLTPFISLPTVQAANEDCTYHLQTYLFLDYMSGPTAYDGAGYTTYTLYPFAFDAQTENNKVTVERITSNNYSPNYNEFYTDILAEEEDLEAFWYTYTNIISTLTTSGYYRAVKYCNPNSSRSQNDCVESQLTGASLIKTDANYDTNTILLHGIWQRASDSGVNMAANWPSITAEEGQKYSYQTAFNSEAINAMNVDIYGASYVSNKFKTTTYDFTADYLNSIINDTDKANDNNQLVYYSKDLSDNYYLPLAINRQIDITYFKKANYYYIYNSTSKYYFSTDDDTITDSYTAWSALSKEGSLADTYLDDAIADGGSFVLEGTTYYLVKSADDPMTSDFEIQFIEGEEDSSYGEFGLKYYWPFVLNVEYSVCPTSNESWNLQYDGNVTDNSVTNIPATQTSKVGSSITVDSKSPSRDGYSFKKWCTNKDGSGDCYTGGEEITSNTSTTITLYAQWGQTGAEDSKKTGVISYVIGFAAVGVIATVIYLISKRKNLFKQV